MHRNPIFILVLLLVAFRAALTPTLIQAAEFTVTRPDDPPPDGCQPSDCSLREAIIAANNVPGADTITLPAGDYRLAIEGASEDAAATGDLDITDDLTLMGAGPDPASGARISPAFQDRIFQITGDIEVTISGLIIAGGDAGLFGSDGGGIFNRQARLTLTEVVIRDNRVLSLGGGIANDEGDLILTNVEIKNNFSWSNGGGIFNKGGKVTLTEVEISGNEAHYALGGGIANSGGEWSMTKVTLSENVAGEFGGGLYNIYGKLTLTDSVIRDNQTRAFSGGGIETVSGLLTLIKVEISGNQASRGGGISNSNFYGRETILTLSNVTIHDNQATYGGGLANGQDSTLIIDNSTLSTNSSETDGGGILNDDGTLTVTNSTLSGNQAAGNGGGLFNGSQASLNSTTLANNSADSDNDGTGDGGGLYNQAPSGAVNLKHTLLAGNSDQGGQAPDCGGQLTSQGYNLVQNTAGCTLDDDLTGNLSGIDPLLGPLALNGGWTLTHLPLTGSPAIDAGDPITCPTADQRGFARPADGDDNGSAVCDIGAVEVGAPVEQVIYLPLGLK